MTLFNYKYTNRPEGVRVLYTLALLAYAEYAVGFGAVQNRPNYAVKRATLVGVLGETPKVFIKYGKQWKCIYISCLLGKTPNP